MENLDKNIKFGKKIGNLQKNRKFRQKWTIWKEWKFWTKLENLVKNEKFGQNM